LRIVRAPAHYRPRLLPSLPFWFSKGESSRRLIHEEDACVDCTDGHGLTAGSDASPQAALV